MLHKRDSQERREPVPDLCACAGTSRCCYSVLQLRLLVSATGQGMSRTGSEQCSQTATACIWSPRLLWLQRLPPCRLWRSGICSHLSAGGPPEGTASKHPQQSDFASRATTLVSRPDVIAAPLTHQQLLCWRRFRSASPRRHAALQHSIEQSTDSQKLAMDASRVHAAACASANSESLMSCEIGG